MMVRPGISSTVSGVVLDTSGFVADYEAGSDHTNPVLTRWSDLSPFEQGYVEAALIAAGAGRGWTKAERRDWPEKTARHVLDGSCPPLPADVAFSDIAPETLAAIRKDCAAYIGTNPDWAYLRDMPGCGAELWRNRQRGILPGFPPLTPSLGDDGKVWLRAAAPDTSERSDQTREDH